MRGIGNHIPPVQTQPEPADNTSEYVNAQVARWVATGVLIATETAREIAAGYQDPRNDDYAPFASTGTIRKELVEDLSTDEPGIDVDKDALRAYILASSLPAGQVWTVGHNIPGYLPEGDLYRTHDRADAIIGLRSEVEHGNDAISHQSEEEGVECTDCDTCNNEGLIGAAFASADGDDDGRSDMSITITDGAKNIVYWAEVNTEPFPAGELAEY